MPPSKRTGSFQGFWVRHSQLLAAVFVVAAAALDFGPDSWMEWVLWGATVVSVEAARIVLSVIAVILVAAILWPLIRPSGSEH